MDHVIDRIEIDINYEFDYFYNELKSNKYGSKFSQQPSYPTLKALIDSVNILRKHIGWRALSIKEMVADREEME